MQIINETELMTNQKASAKVAPDVQFEALETEDGNSILLSIGSDNILYSTEEVPGDEHGWTRTDLSSMLSSSVYGGATVAAKNFDVAQDLSNNSNVVNIALIVTVAGQDFLHLALGIDNTNGGWANPISWTQFPFDDYMNMAYKSCPINDVQILSGNGSQYIIADIISNSSINTISRYGIDSTKSNYADENGDGCAWVPQSLAFDLQAGQIKTILGCGPYDGPTADQIGVGGAYTLGTVSNVAQLSYTPSYNVEDPGAAAEPTIFTLPQGISATYMAMGLSAPTASAPYTDLFFASQGTLYFLSNENQKSSAGNLTPVAIYTHELFNQVQSLNVENWNNNIVIWGQSVIADGMNSSQLFIMEGIAGEETQITSWSCPIPLLYNVLNSASYVNSKNSISSAASTAGNIYGSCNVLFAHQDDGSFVQLFQDPITSAWQERFLLTTPVIAVNELYTTVTYSTHFEFTDDNNLPIGNVITSDAINGDAITGTVSASLWASSPCSVYITDANNNAAYFCLDHVIPLVLKPDFSGNITIMQPIDTIGGISYYLTAKYLNPVTQLEETSSVVVNPLKQTLSDVNSNVANGGLGVSVTDEKGNVTPLVPSGTSNQAAVTSNLEAAYSQTITNSNTAVNVPQDGLVQGQSWPSASVSTVLSNQTPNPLHLIANLKFNPEQHQIHGITLGKQAMFYEGVDAMAQMGVKLNADGSLTMTLPSGELGNIWNAIESKAGHLFKWMKTESNKLESSLNNIINITADNVVHCLFTISGNVYHFIIKCMNDVANIMHILLTSLEIAFQDVVKWVGAILNYQDILRTHNVMKTVIVTYINEVISNFSSVSTDITNSFSQLETLIDKTTGLPTQGIPSSEQNYGGAMKTSSPQKGSKSPSANYGTHHFKTNAANADNDYGPNVLTLSEDIFDDLMVMCNNEAGAFSTAGESLKLIVSNLSNTPLTQILEELMGVVADLLLNTAEDFLQGLISVIQTILNDSVNVLNSTIHIPVLTDLYKKMTVSEDCPLGDDLTIIDLACLISAIPSTIIYKAVKGAAPFPDNAVTSAILSATDINSLQLALGGLSDISSTGGTTQLGHGSSQTGMTPLNIVGSVSSTFGTVIISYSLFVKSNLPSSMSEAQTDTNRLFSAINAGGFMLYMLPDLTDAVQNYINPNNKWYDVMNHSCTWIAGGKVIVDAILAWLPDGKPSEYYGKYISPGADFLLNVAWQIPTVYVLIEQLKEADKFTPADINSIVSCVGGTAFDLTGVWSPMLATVYNTPPSQDRTIGINVLLAQIITMNIIWSGSCLVTTFDGLPINS